LNKNIFSFELDGKQVLGFNTGLNPRSFAQAKMADCITQHGFVIYPDGAIESWQPGGVTEYTPSANMPSVNANLQSEGTTEGTMVIWGSDFPGEELTAIASAEGREDEALNAIRFWLKAAAVMGNKFGTSSFPGPSGAFIITTLVVAGEKASPKNRYPVGTVFFPPARLLKRTLDAAGDEALLDAGRFFHPDLIGDEAVSFSAGVMLYRVFCAASPFKRDNQDELRQDIREGVFIPPNLAKPGLSEELSGIISDAMRAIPKKNEIRSRPTPDQITAFLGPPFSGKVSSWIKSLSDEELSKIRAEYTRYDKKSSSTVKARRFLIRYKVAVAVSLAALIVLLFIVRGMVRRQAELPTTKGMTPVEVAQTYYGSLNDLDQTTMEACVSGRTGRDDITMVMNFFVITRMRQGYEMRDSFFSAQRWIDAGKPVTYDTVFGITDLKISVISQGETNTSLEADYILWVPGSSSTDDFEAGNSGEEPEEFLPVPPEGIVTKDRLTFTFEKDQWRITAIDRTTRVL
jgi:hypothetical protein